MLPAIIAIIILIILGIPIAFFLGALIEVARVVIALMIIPPLVKFFADYILYYVADLDKRVSIVLGALFSVLIAIVLYQNFWALFIGGIIIYGIYIAADYAIKNPGDLKTALSLGKWLMREVGGKKK